MLTNRFIRLSVNDDKMKFWLGARKIHNREFFGKWSDDDSTMYPDDGYTNWAEKKSGENKEEKTDQCLLLDRGKWEWQQCSNQSPFICKASVKND